MPMQSLQDLTQSVREASYNRSKTAEDLFHSVKESGDHHLSGVVASASAVQKRFSPTRGPRDNAFRPNNADPSREIQWQTGVVNAIIQYVDIVSAVFASLLEASELLASGGICVMMEGRLGTKPLVDYIKTARHKVSNVAEVSRETLQDMATGLGACMEELTQAERAKSEYDHYTNIMSLLNDESDKNAIANIEEESDATRSCSGQISENTSGELAHHRIQSLTEKLERSVDDSEKKAFDSWQACRRRVDELGSLADRIVCEVVRALGSMAACGVSLRSSSTAPTTYGLLEHFTVNLCPVLVELESGSLDHASGHVEDTYAAPLGLHVDVGCPGCSQIDEKLQQKKEKPAAVGDSSHAGECSIHDRPSSTESDIKKQKYESSACGFDGSNESSLERSVSPLSPPATSGYVAGQKGVSYCGQNPQLCVLSEQNLVRVQGESVDDASAVTVLIGNEAMSHPEMSPQLNPSISGVLIDRLHDIPAHLGQTNKNIICKLLKSIAILPDDLFSLNEAVFNVPVGSRIDANAISLLFDLMEQIHLVFRHGRYDKSDQNFLRDYVALLGTMQNQPFFDSQQGRAFHTWLFEALENFEQFV